MRLIDGYTEVNLILVQLEESVSLWNCMFLEV